MVNFNITDFSDEILMNIFEKLDESSLHFNSLVCKLFKQISEDNSLWKNYLNKRRLPRISKNSNFKKNNLEFIKKYNSFFQKLYQIPNLTSSDSILIVDAYIGKKQIDDFIKDKNLTDKFLNSLTVDQTSLEETLYYNEAGALNYETLKRSLLFQLYEIIKLHLEEGFRLYDIYMLLPAELNELSHQILELILTTQVDILQEAHLHLALKKPGTLELLLKFWKKDVPRTLLTVAEALNAPEASMNLIKEALNKSDITQSES